MSDVTTLSIPGHDLKVTRSTYERPSEDGRHMEEHPTGGCSYRCSCGAYGGGAIPDVMPEVTAHLGLDSPEPQP